MSTLVVTDPTVQPAPCHAQRDHANLALRRVLDAEIEALKARLRQRSTTAGASSGLPRDDLDPQLGWLRDSVGSCRSVVTLDNHYVAGGQAAHAVDPAIVRVRQRAL